MWVVGEEVPGIACFVDDIIVVAEDGDGEFVAAQIFPDVFDWIEFRGIGGQADKCDVVRDDERFGDVIAGAVDDESGMAAWRNLAADGGQMQRHGLGIGGRQDQAGGEAALGAGGTEQIGPVVALIARRTWPASPLGPDPGQRALLANACLVLEPDFDRLANGVVGDPLRDGGGKVFLKACWAASSACGWRGRTDSRR